VRVEAEVQRAERVVARQDGVEGVVRVATTEGLATLLVERGLLQLLEQHPGLTIELLSGNRPLDMGAGEADLALRLVRPEAGEVRVRKLAELELAVCASSAYVARRGAPRSEAELAGHRALVTGGELARLPESRWLAEVPGVRVALRTASMPALAVATRAGVGIAALPVAWARLDGLEILFPAPVPPRPLWLAVAPDAANRPAVRAVAERLATLVEAG
jgi:DNA-binding transcriptional LysR family regulator